MIETIRIGTLKWSHIVRPTDEDLQILKDHYHFHPLDIDDCKATTNLRPKIDIYDDYYFMILHFPGFDQTDTFVDVKEIKFFWGKDFLISIGKSHWLDQGTLQPGEKTNNRWEKTGGRNQRCPFVRNN